MARLGRLWGYTLLVERVSTAFAWAVGALAMLSVSGALLARLSRGRAVQRPGDAQFALIDRS